MVSLTGQNLLAPHRFYVLQALIEECLPALLIGLFLQGVTRYLKLTMIPINKKAVGFLLWVGIAASFPLLISPKQLRFYIVPAMGWYALAWGLFCWPAFLALVAYTKTWKRSKMLLTSLIWLGIAGCLVVSFTNRGKNARQADVLGDTRTIGAVVPAHSNFYIDQSLYNKWHLHAYFYRYYYIDLTTFYQGQTYVLVPKGVVWNQPTYQKQELGLKTLDLYKYGY